MGLRTRVSALYIGDEVTPGVDPTITGTDYVPAADLTFAPNQDQIQSDVAKPYLGADPSTAVNLSRSVTHNIQQGLESGTAGTAPAVGRLLLACGMDEVVVTDTSVTYTPLTDNSPTKWIERYLDGNKFVLPHCRGNFQFQANVNQYATYAFTWLGLDGTDATAPPPAPVLTPWNLRSMPVTPVNTPTFTIDGNAHGLKQFSLDRGAVNAKNTTAGAGAETVDFIDASASITVTIEAVNVSTADWLSIMKSGATAQIVLVHGTTAGRITTVTAPICELNNVAEGDDNGTATHTLSYTVLPDSGNDDFSIALT